VHRNAMGSTYNLVRLVYALDGAEIYSKSDESGHLGDSKEFEIFSGSIVPGNHTLSVLMVYQGNGYRVFSYLKGYKFNVRSSHTFQATEGKQTQLKVAGFEKGNPLTTDPKDRPAVDFRLNVVTDKPTGTPPGGSRTPRASLPARRRARPPARLPLGPPLLREDRGARRRRQAVPARAGAVDRAGALHRRRRSRRRLPPEAGRRGRLRLADLVG